jgi:tetratricopeptide (TPR) repeat protein
MTRVTSGKPRWFLFASLLASGLVVTSGTLVSCPPQSVQESVDRALDAYRAQNYSQARIELERSLSLDPNSPPSHELLGLVLDAQNETVQARAELEKALALAPGNETYRINLVTFYLKSGLVEDAERTLQPLLTSSPSADVYQALGYIRIKQRQERESIPLLKKAVTLDPKRLDAWYWVGFAHQSLGEYGEALACYEEVLKRDGQHFRSHLQMGKIYLVRGMSAQALTELSLASQLCPHSSAAYRYLSEAQSAAGESDAALASAKEAVRLMPDDPRAHYQLGRVMQHLGMLAQAKAELQLARYRKVDSPGGSRHQSRQGCADEDTNDDKQ